MFYFVRHGQTDYSLRNSLIYQGFGTQLAPLSPLGICQIEKTARDPRLQGAKLILASPYTRAVQTAAILSRALDAPLVVETQRHEWLANRQYIYEPDSVAEARYQAYRQHHGCHPQGQDCLWESAEQMRMRVLNVLGAYRTLDSVIVAGHGMMIEAVTGASHPENGEIVEFSF